MWELSKLIRQCLNIGGWHNTKISIINKPYTDLLRNKEICDIFLNNTPLFLKINWSLRLAIQVLHVFNKTNTILRSKRFRIELLRESWSESKGNMEGGEGGAHSTPPPPLFLFFALISTVSTNSRGKACYAGKSNLHTCCGDRRVFITALYQVLSSVCSTPHSTPGLISLKGVLTLFCKAMQSNWAKENNWGHRWPFNC